MDTLSILTVTYTHVFVLVISTHMHQICALFLSCRTSKGKDNHEAISPTNETDRNIISAAIHLVCYLAEMAMFFNIAFFFFFDTVF